jgi:ABC-type glutathione transport system ATPase component
VEKCNAYIKDFKKKGGTILFVSHSFPAIRAIADRCLWLDHGKVVAEGSPDDVIKQYQATGKPPVQPGPGPAPASGPPPPATQPAAPSPAPRIE